MQVPGPTLIVTEGQTVTVNLTNNLPTPAGNTSILFPGFKVTTTGGVAGLLTKEAAPGGTVTYTFIAATPGTHSYYSGTQGDLQVEMGLYGAVIVLPSAMSRSLHQRPALRPTWPVGSAHGEADFRLAAAAYDHDKTCYDREYLFQFSEMDPQHPQPGPGAGHRSSCGTCTAATAPGCSLEVPTEPYHPAYFMINGRSMPDDMDPNYDTPYPHQPYNGNPHMHPGELVLLRIIGQGRWQHPFHEHANHVRILARDGNLILSAPMPRISPALRCSPPHHSRPDHGRNLLLHRKRPELGHVRAPSRHRSDANGNAALHSRREWLQHHAAPRLRTAINYYEWCQDHNKPLEVNPVGDVAGGGPATLPNPLILTNGAWYSGSPYLGPDATTRASRAPNTNLLPSNTQANPASERGWAFMWHSHNEREITTNNVFPGGMMMMMLVDSREFVIDESN